MIAIEDQIGSLLHFEKPPKRIICLVPSLTELLIDLELSAYIVGRTKFCIYPVDKVNSISKVGGTKTPDIDKIKSLHPDFIIANKEENNQEDIDELQSICPVYVSDIVDRKDNTQVISDIGKICGCEKRSTELNQSIDKNFDGVDWLKFELIDVVYFIWKDPYMVSGSHNFINSILKEIGFRNIYSSSEDRYPEIRLADLKENNNIILLLSNEPFPFTEKHTKEISRILPDHIIEFVDATYFSWYGSRMLLAPKYLSTLRKRIDEIVKTHKA